MLYRLHFTDRPSTCSSLVQRASGKSFNGGSSMVLPAMGSINQDNRAFFDAVVEIIKTTAEVLTGPFTLFPFLDLKGYIG